LAGSGELITVAEGGVEKKRKIKRAVDDSGIPESMRTGRKGITKEKVRGRCKVEKTAGEGE